MEEIVRRGGKRRRDVIDSSEDEETSLKKSHGRKRRIGSGQNIWQEKHHGDQRGGGCGEAEVILILDSSEEENPAIKKEEEKKEDPRDSGHIGARPPHPGSTTSDDISRLTFHHVLGRGSFGQVSSLCSPSGYLFGGCLFGIPLVILLDRWSSGFFLALLCHVLESLVDCPLD
ncbi:hypothetical protein GDO78_006731 [Eleutherodactylus coqui]|uniref:Uncharacterized protein n=1 Tax=Eleutherodactylus coqui TaxID=57060 RepID=A0A8J6FE31_ELECQ|nr:hypothetical protein GDO78_006731 [Eleutherodactylus coqui]